MFDKSKERFTQDAEKKKLALTAAAQYNANIRNVRAEIEKEEKELSRIAQEEERTKEELRRQLQDIAKMLGLGSLTGGAIPKGKNAKSEKTLKETFSRYVKGIDKLKNIKAERFPTGPEKLEGKDIFNLIGVLSETVKNGIKYIETVDIFSVEFIFKSIMMLNNRYLNIQKCGFRFTATRISKKF